MRLGVPRRIFTVRVRCCTYFVLAEKALCSNGAAAAPLVALLFTPSAAWLALLASDSVRGQATGRPKAGSRTTTAMATASSITARTSSFGRFLGNKNDSGAGLTHG